MAQRDKLKDTKRGESRHVTRCTHTPLTSAAAQGIPVHLVTTYIVCVSILGDTRILPCKRSSIQEESEGVRVNGAI